MSGHFTSHYLAEILRDLFFDESTGTIVLRSGSEAWVRLYFDRGMLYFADGGSAQDGFTSHLEASGLLAAPVVQKLAESAPSPLEMAARLGRTGTLSAQDLAPVVRGVVERSVERAFSWTGGTHEFEAGEATAGFFDPDVIFTFECILRGIEEMAYFGPLKDVLLRLPGHVSLGRETFIPVERLALRAHHGYLLSRLDGSMRMEDIALLLTPDDEESSLKFLYGLAVLGLLEFDPPARKGPFSLRELMHEHQRSVQREERESALIADAVSGMTGKTPAQLLGVPPGADLPAARAAFDHARGLFRRERFSDRIRERHKKDLAFIESKLTEAFLRLEVERLERSGQAAGAPLLAGIDPDELIVRREMVKTEAQAAQEETTKLAERYFQKAREYFVEKDFHNCIQYCRLAIKYNGEIAPVHALMAEALARNPNTRWQRMAEESWQRACELDPWNADYCTSLGMFYKSRGMDLRARRQFEKALEILPSHAGARAALRGGGR